MEYEPGGVVTGHNHLSLVEKCTGASSEVAVWACSLTAESLSKVPAEQWKQTSDKVPGCPITLSTLRDAMPASSVPGLSDPVMQRSIKRALTLHRKSAVGKVPEALIGVMDSTPLRASPSLGSTFGSPCGILPTVSPAMTVKKLPDKEVRAQVKEYLAQCFTGSVKKLGTQGTQGELQQVVKLITAITNCRHTEYEHLRTPQLNSIMYLVLSTDYCSEGVSTFLSSKLLVWRMDGGHPVATYSPLRQCGWAGLGSTAVKEICLLSITVLWRSSPLSTTRTHVCCSVD
eukprot:COSAG05_NODE_1070_length_5967_cov_444.629857_4_plen_287_part_00